MSLLSLSEFEAISIWHLSEPTFVGPNNPSGWNFYGGNETTWLDYYLNAALGVMESIGSKKLLIWDIEGSSGGLDLQYVGDPRRMRRMNPKMDYGKLAKRLQSAGIDWGLLLRPTNIINGKHAYVADPLYNLASKVDFARKLGCQMFYVDSNVREAVPNYPNSWVEGIVMPATIFFRLCELFPDCIFFPEHKDTNYYWDKRVIPYRDAGKGEFETPSYIKEAVPWARSFINISGADLGLLRKNWDALRIGRNLIGLDAWVGGPVVQEYIKLSRGE